MDNIKSVYLICAYYYEDSRLIGIADSLYSAQMLAANFYKSSESYDFRSWPWYIHPCNINQLFEIDDWRDMPKDSHELKDEDDAFICPLFSKAINR